MNTIKRCWHLFWFRYHDWYRLKHRRDMVFHECQQDDHRTAVYNMDPTDPFNRAALEVMKPDVAKALR